MRSRVRFKYLLVIIPFLLISLMSQNTFAVSLTSFNFLKANYAYNGGGYAERILYNATTPIPSSIVYPGSNWTNYNLNYFVISGNTPTSLTGQYFNFVVNFEILAQNWPYAFNNSSCVGLTGYILPEQGSVDSENHTTACEVSNNGSILNLTAVSSGKLSQTTNISSWYSMMRNDTNSLIGCSNLSQSMLGPCQNKPILINLINVELSVSEDPLVAGQTTIINQNNTIISQNEEMINRENQAIDNIDNQSTSDIEGAENQATTNLIGVLSNFFTQLQNFQATNCDLDLPFPEFIGGTQTVNICQGKDVLGNFITVIGTLAMVGFYIPLAWVLLKMIYNEIRSFTNG